MAGEKFTPGPHEIEYDNCDCGSGQWYKVGPFKVEFPYSAPAQVEERAKADAALAQAAPDLYVALSEVLPLAVARLVELRLIPPDQRPVDHPKLAAAFVALKKARGEVQGVG
jgi:hypothetical protein